MKLFLASKASDPESIKKLKDFVGKDLEGLKVVYIPTAANGDGWEHWKKGGSIALAKSLWPNMKVLQLEDVGRSEDIAKIIGTPDILWIAGGMLGYLLYWIRRTKLDKALPKILKSGTIYVGSSAGSVLWSKTCYLAEIYPDDEEPGASLLPGLGYIDFEIFPHYEDRYMDFLKKSWNKGPLYLLKNGEVITVVDGKVKVLGEKRVFG